MRTILTKAFGILLMIFIGFVLKKKGYLKDDDRKALSNLVFTITLPCVLISSFQTFEYNNSLFLSILIGLGINIFMTMVGHVISTGRSKEIRSVYMLSCSGFNIGTFTFPFVSNFLDASSMIIVAMFDIGNAIMSLGGTYAVTASLTGGSAEKGGFKEFVKRLTSSVPFLTYTIMLVISLAGVRLPGFVYDITNMIGGASTFLIMVIVGLMLEVHIPKEDIKDIRRVVLIRYIGSLLFALLIYFLLPIPINFRKALMIGVFAPSTAVSIVFCQKLGCKPSTASAINSLCIPASLVCITLLLLFIR